MHRFVALKIGLEGLIRAGESPECNCYDTPPLTLSFDKVLPHQVVRGWSPAEFGEVLCIVECSLCYNISLIAYTDSLVIFYFLGGSIGRGILIGPCTTHPFTLGLV